MQCQGLQIEVKDVSEAQWIVYQEFAFARFFFFAVMLCRTPHSLF